MESDIPEEYRSGQAVSGGRRHYTHTAVLPRSAMPARPDREVEMSEASSTYAAAAAGASSRASRSHYYEKSQHYQCKFLLGLG